MTERRMIMNRAELGKRIREARIAQKMTQSELVGDFITRNMLSQIESGLAAPSMKTLQYIADALGMSLSSLVGEEKPEIELERAPDAPTETEEFLTAKSLFKAEKYEAALERLVPLCRENSDFYDETAGLLARTYLALSQRLCDGGETQKAISCAEKCTELSATGIYASREIRTNALLLLDRLAEQLTRK